MEPQRAKPLHHEEQQKKCHHHHHHNVNLGSMTTPVMTFDADNVLPGLLPLVVQNKESNK